MSGGTAIGPGYVYRLFNAAGRLLYVGFSMWPEFRIPEHQGKVWFGEIAMIAVEKHPGRAAALAAETAAIESEWPLWNFRHSPDEDVARRITYRIEMRKLDAAFASIEMRRTLRGAAKRSHEARRSREFEQRDRHVKRVIRMASEAQLAADNLSP